MSMFFEQISETQRAASRRISSQEGLVQPSKWPAMILIVIVSFVLSISFRVKTAGDTGLDVQNGMKLAIWAGLIAISALRWRDLALIFAKPVGFLVAAFGALALVSSLWSAVPFYTLASASGFIAYFCLAGLVLTDLTIDEALLVLRRSIFAFVLIGLILGFVWPELAWQAPSVEETVYRLQGLGANPNGFGQLCGILIALLLASWWRRVLPAPWFVGTMTIAVTCLALSGDRTAMLAVTASSAVVLARTSVVVRRILFTFATLFALALAFYATGYGPSLSDALRLVSRTGTDSEILTLTGRTDLWSAAIDRILERPLFGWGYNGTEELMASTMSTRFFGSSVNPHQMYLQLALNLGFAGIVCWLGILAVIVRNYCWRPDRLRDLLIGFVLFNGMAEADIFATPVASTLIFFWLLLADPSKLSMSQPDERP